MTKKNFKDSIAANFMTKSEEVGQSTTMEQETSLQTDTIPKIKKYAVNKPETKSRRIQSLVKPSTYKALEKTAKTNKISINELINIILEKEMKED